jgi:hypothetical protein
VLLPQMPPNNFGIAWSLLFQLFHPCCGWFMRRLYVIKLSLFTLLCKIDIICLCSALLCTCPIKQGQVRSWIIYMTVYYWLLVWCYKFHSFMLAELVSVFHYVWEF